MWTRINVPLWSRNCSEAFPVWTQALSVIQFATFPFDLKRSFTKMRFRCNFCSDKSVQTWFGPFQKPIRYGTFYFQQRSGAVLFRSRNCFESSIPSVNRSPIRYTFCDAPFHYPVQCEHSLTISVLCFETMPVWSRTDKSSLGYTLQCSPMFNWIDVLWCCCLDSINAAVYTLGTLSFSF